MRPPIQTGSEAELLFGRRPAQPVIDGSSQSSFRDRLGQNQIEGKTVQKTQPGKKMSCRFGKISPLRKDYLLSLGDALISPLKR